MGCCKGTGACGCVQAGAVDDGCDPVQISVSGAGTTASPFLIAANTDLSRVVQTAGWEPWQIETVAGCDLITPRIQYEATPSVLMANGAGALQGYAVLVLDGDAGTATWKYQALDTSTLQTSLPSGWRPACGWSEGVAFHPLYTDGSDLTTLAGYVIIRRDLSGGTYDQRYVTLAGSVTSTKPGSWEQADCAVASGGGGGGGGGSSFPDPLPGSIHLYLQSGTVLNDKKYPDWGQPGLDTSKRWDALHLPPDYTGADWTRMVVTVVNVSNPLTTALKVTLKDLTNAVDVATWTWPAGTAPVSNALHADKAITSGSFTDWIKVQWHIETVEADNAFGLHAEAFYEATAGFAS